MVTNTYLPIVGGLELSIASFTAEYRRRGHRVVIVAPEFENSPADEFDVIRVPALKNFNGSKYSVKFPMPVFYVKALGEFKPDIVHTHHPFLMGDTALRLAYAHNVPLVFTHHSIYEENMHWMPGASESLKKFIIGLSTGYANFCDTVIAPSESVAELIKEHGVNKRVAVIPTGLHLNQFTGTSENFKQETGIPEKAFVVGYVGRLAEEKNLPFLMRAVALFLKKEPSALFLVVGSGPMDETIALYFKELKIEKQLRMAGEMKGKKLIEAFQAIDVFAFASQSETQGMVLNEAMAAGTPVVAVDAPGVRDIVVDEFNGRLIAGENEEDFSRALGWVFAQTAAGRNKLTAGAKETAKRYSVELSAGKALEVYENLKAAEAGRRKSNKRNMFQIFRHLTAEWRLVSNFMKAAIGIFV
jgi:glycosyltransferase involved in cell wall biosynthesis